MVNQKGMNWHTRIDSIAKTKSHACFAMELTSKFKTYVPVESLFQFDQTQYSIAL